MFCGYVDKSSCAANCVGFTKMLAITLSQSTEKSEQGLGGQLKAILYLVSLIQQEIDVLYVNNPLLERIQVAVKHSAQRRGMFSLSPPHTPVIKQ